jgi:hypothetical protein
MAIRRVVFDPNHADGNPELYPHVDAYEMAEWEHDFPEDAAAMEELAKRQREDLMRTRRAESARLKAEARWWEDHPREENEDPSKVLESQPWEPDYRLSDREHDRRLRLRPNKASGQEKALREDELGVESGGVIYEAPIGDPAGTGRNRNWHKATKVYGKDDPENFRYKKIGKTRTRSGSG